MPLKVSDGIAAWIKDFQKSDAPQFKGKSKDQRRDQAVAAYLSAKRGPLKKEDAFTQKAVDDGKMKPPSRARLDAIQKQKDAEKKAVDKAISRLRRKNESATHASADKKPENYRDEKGVIRTRMVPVKKKVDEDFTFRVDVEGLPALFMKGNSPGSVKAHLRKLVKQPSMVKDVKRVTKHDKKKEFRKRSMEEVKESTSALVSAHAAAEKAHRSAAKREADRGIPGNMMKHAAAADHHKKARQALASGDHKAAVKHTNTAMRHVSYTNVMGATPSWARKAGKASKAAATGTHKMKKRVTENRRDRLRAKFAAVGKDMKKTNDELKKITTDYKKKFGTKKEYKYDYGSPESVKLMKKITPGQSEDTQNEKMTFNKFRSGLYKTAKAMGDVQAVRKKKVGKRIARRAAGKVTGRMLKKLFNQTEGVRGKTDAPKGPESYEAQYKRRLVKTTDPEHKEKGYKYRIKGKKNSALTKKLYKSKPDQAEFNRQMRRIAGHEFG